MADSMDKPAAVERAEQDDNLKTTKYDEADVFAVHSRVSWSALFAGAVVALSTFLLLSVLGAAIGLSVNDPGADGLGWGATIWAVVTTLISLFLGGWLATQCTAGENTTEGIMYGVIHWGLVFAILAFLTTSGLAAGFNTMLGVANVVSHQSQMNLDQLTQGTNLSPADRAQLEENVRSTFNSDNASEAAWWTFAGMALSMLASVAGATAGSGPSPVFRAWVIQPKHRPAMR
jgi:hypothetical protein